MGINFCKPRIEVFREGDDVSKIAEGTKQLIIHGSVRETPKGSYTGSPFPGYKSIEELTIEEGVEVIGNNTFNNCKNLKSVSFPSSLKEIGEEAFFKCSSLTEVDLTHTKVIHIGKLAFRNCKNLSEESINEVEKLYEQMYERSKQEHGEDNDDTQRLKANLNEFQKDCGRYLNEDTLENLKNLHGFIKCRDKINKIAEKVLPNNYMKDYPSFKPPETLRQSKDNLSDIMKASEEALPEFTKLLREIALKNELSPDEDATFDGERVMLDDDTPYKQLTIAPLKKEERSREKIENEYGGDASRIVDIVRASFVTMSEEQLVGIAKLLQELHDQGIIKIVRLKNRFSEPLWNGYRDALYNIEVNGVICEVQLHLGGVVFHKKESHEYYGHFRSYFAGNVDACIDLIKMLEKCIDTEATDMEVMLQKILESEDETLIYNMDDLVEKMGDYYLMEVFRRRLCELDPEYVGYKNNLAEAFRMQGKYKEAEEIHRECLEVKKKTLGETDPSTLNSMNNLALALDDQGKYKEAEEIHRECLEVKKKTLGETDPSTLNSMMNLASTLDDQEKYKEAEEMHRECLELQKKTLGETHPDTLGSMNNLAHALDGQEKYNEAEEMHRECLELKKKTLGETHPSTLNSIRNLGHNLYNQGKYADAMKIYEECYELMKRVDHPETDEVKQDIEDCLGLI